MKSTLPVKIREIRATYHDTVDICKPFFKQYDLSFFLYARFFNDGTFYGLMTSPWWIDYGFQRKLALVPPTLPKDTKNLSFFIFWKEIAPEWIIQEVSKLGAYNPLAYFDITHDYCDLYSYATNHENRDNASFYLNKFEVLKKFRPWFKEKSTPMLKMIDKNKFWLPNESRVSIAPAFIKKINTEKSFERLNIFEFERSWMSNRVNAQISKREFECLIHLSDGRTTKESARLMDLSPKTVTNYVYNLKCKVGVSTKGQLIEIYHNIKRGTYV